MSQEEILKIVQENPGILMRDIPIKYPEFKHTYKEQVRKLAFKKEITRVMTKSNKTYELWSNV